MNLCDDANRELTLEMISRIPTDQLGVLLLFHQEFESAKEKHPEYPKDHIHQAAIIGEEAGEVIKAALQFKYEKKPRFNMHSEVIQTGAMALRFIVENFHSKEEKEIRRVYED